MSFDKFLFFSVILCVTHIFGQQDPVIGGNGEITYSEVPLYNELYPRDVSNKGTVTFSGTVNSNIYDQIRIQVYKNSSFLEYYDENLSFSGNTASFNINIPIDAELSTYDFRVYLKTPSTQFSRNPAGCPNSTCYYLPGNYCRNIVAGDVYVIGGQSNAVADMKTPPGQSSDAYKDDFIRTFACPTNNNNLLNQFQWETALGDRPFYQVGFLGQWGITLAKKIVVNKGIPVAIFNGAMGNTQISYHLKNADESWNLEPTDMVGNIYNRLLLRLNYNNLRSHVKAIFWSQGENDGAIGTSTESYINMFNQLKSSWFADFSNLSKIYIFQTKAGCVDLPDIGDKVYKEIKEAQRQLAENDTRVHLMQTTGLENSDGNFYCHFPFINGYEEFANRIYKLVDRDFYGGSYSSDIEAPMPTLAYLSAPNVITLETDAVNLSISDPNNFDLGDYFINGASASITDITVNGNKIEIQFSGSINGATSLTYEGVGGGENPTSLIINSESLELVCFDKFPLHLESIWNGSSWFPIAPSPTMDVLIDGPYDASDGDLKVNDLTINNGETINFDRDNGGSGQSIVVNGDLNISGTMIIGDTESLVIPNNTSNVAVTGTFKKLEKTTVLKTQYDVTYFSSPVQGANLASTFPGVDANRIFYFDPTVVNNAYTGAYEKYRHWHIASGSMSPGKGYSVDGPTGVNNQKMSVEFDGTPNFGNISVAISQYSSINGDYDRTNLIGNPYPAAIDAKKLIEANSNFEGTLYLWDHSEDYVTGEYIADYMTFNLGGGVPSTIPTDYKIGSGQGFMILANQPSAQFNFLTSMQVESNNDQFFKSKDKKSDPVTKMDNTWIQISLNNNLKKEILITFSKNADKGFNKGYDGKLLNVDAPTTFYSFLKQDKFVIQGLNYYAPYSEITLGYKIDEPGQYSIGISKFEGNTDYSEVYLLDRELQINHDLKVADYNFSQIQTGAVNDRFKLVFRRNISAIKKDEKSSAENSIIIYNLDSSLRIRSEKRIEEISVYNVLGSRIGLYKVNSEDFEMDLQHLTKGSILFLEFEIKDIGIVRKKTILL